MLIKLSGGRVYDPMNGVDGELKDLFIQDGRLVTAPRDGRVADQTLDLSGRVIMAGAIDLHTHIGGGKVNIARMMLPEDHARDPVDNDRHPHAGCTNRAARAASR